jgi:hypothetical protein
MTSSDAAKSLLLEIMDLRTFGGLRDELQGHSIHTVPQACRWRSVVENVTEMTEAARAMHLGARHEK